MTNTEKTREELKAAAFELGAMLATVGDFYDVAEELAKGYAAGVMQADTLPERIVSLEMGALNELQSVAASVLGWRVDDARKLHLSWSDIGDVLDVSKQAAQQKYGPKG
jgi:hypothetical protein